MSINRDMDSVKRFNNLGKLHNLFGPAVEYVDGGEEWWVDGELDRLDGPAIECVDGHREWWVGGERHRVDGPAIEWADGTLSWYYCDMCHREDGPAIIQPDGTKFWYWRNMQHRLDGPAVEWADGSYSWWLFDVLVTEQIVLRPETITFEQIEGEENLDRRSIMVERYGWHRYLTSSNSKLIDSRDNWVENTKEALFSSVYFGNRFMVSCPTGRIFVLGVPEWISSCELAQSWLGSDMKNRFNVIGRT